MTTYSLLDTALSLGGLAVLLLPVVVLLERTHRRARSEDGRPTSRVAAPDDADRRRVADERRAAAAR